MWKICSGVQHDGFGIRTTLYDSALLRNYELLEIYLHSWDMFVNRLLELAKIQRRARTTLSTSERLTLPILYLQLTAQRTSLDTSHLLESDYVRTWNTRAIDLPCDSYVSIW